jgi:hypothetical protein
MQGESEDDLVNSLLPVGSTALRIFRLGWAAVKKVQRKRLTMFLEDIGRFSDEMTESERERFEAYVTSEDGQELLVDLADRAVRTRSQTAIAALAILFANPLTEDFDEVFVERHRTGLKQSPTKLSLHSLHFLCGVRGRIPQLYFCLWTATSRARLN